MINSIYKNKIVQLLLTIFLSCLACLCFKSVYWDNSIKVELNAKANKNVNYQIYYSDSTSKPFDEPQSVHVENKDINSYQILDFSLPLKESIALRLDFGDYPQRIEIASLKINGSNINLKELFTKGTIHQIDNIEFINDKVILISNQKDPYVIFQPEISRWKSEEHISREKLLSLFINSCLVFYIIIFQFLAKKWRNNGGERELIKKVQINRKLDSVQALRAIAVFLVAMNHYPGMTCSP